MRRTLPDLAALIALTAAAPARAADEYTIDEARTSVYFKISQLNLSFAYARFDEVSGASTLDGDDAGKSSFTLSVKTASIDTNNKNRDDHLRSPDFFNVRQYPAMTFKSTAVKAVDGGLEVTGDLSLHGATKSVTFPLKGGKTAGFPKGTQRTGFTTELKLKRSDYGMDKLLDSVGDEVSISISFEGTKK
jgi:polyisoprenoid-binding protein YceI